MRKKVLLSVTIIAIFVLATFFVYRQNRNKNNAGYFPPEATQQERDDAKKLPREKCSCWVETKKGFGECHPLTDCI